jgi:hypothetical protein
MCGADTEPGVCGSPSGRSRRCSRLLASSIPDTFWNVRWLSGFLPGRRLAVKVVYNLGAEDERIVVTVELGRPTRRSRGPAEPEGGEQ